MNQLLNKTVFITGALSGIGKECAMLAAKEGANVVLADIESDNAGKVLDEVRVLNANAVFVPCDVSNFNQVHEAVTLTVKTFGTLDVALNNAGIVGVASSIGYMKEEDWLQVIGVNLNGVFNCMKHQLQQMALQKQGVIINMASILSKVGFATAGHYVAAKHGVIGLTQTAALEYAEQGIRINAICPGFIDTPLLVKSGISADANVKQHIVSLHPIKRLGKPREIANGFLFLASDESPFITGASFDLDGGYLAQ